MDQCSDGSSSDEPEEVQHPWPYLASMFRIKSIDGTKIKLTCLLCLPLHVECSAYATSPSNLRKHHRCQPSRNRAGNPAFWLISRVPAFLRKHPAFLALFQNNKNSMKIAIILFVDILFEKNSVKTSIIASPRH